MCDKVPNNASTGHTKITIRNSTYYGSQLSITPYLHQLGIVAKGEAGQLRDCRRGGSQEVSHLCGNGRCFNPAHLTVESARLNEKRQTCQGQYSIGFAGYTYHPCPPGREEKHLTCILPHACLPPGCGFFGLTYNNGPRLGIRRHRHL